MPEIGQPEFTLQSKSLGVRILTQRYHAAPEVTAMAPDQLEAFVPLRRVGLIQLTAVDEELRSRMGLDQVAFTSLFDVILDEAMPLIKRDPQAVVLRLDGQDTAGAVLTYRGLQFLFADRNDPLVTEDFVVYRPAAEDIVAGWPAVESPAGR